MRGCYKCIQKSAARDNPTNNEILYEYIISRIKEYDSSLVCSDLYRVYTAVRRIITLLSDNKIKGSSLSYEKLHLAKELVDTIIPTKVCKDTEEDWISVNDRSRKIPVAMDVLVYTSFGTTAVGCMNPVTRKWNVRGHVTHWRYLPDDPMLKIQEGDY